MASKSAAFADRIDQIVLNGWIAAGLCMGSRLGLFKGLYELANTRETAVTTQQLADKLRMKERYIREWINGMVCGNIIDHCEVDDVDLFWIEEYRYVGIVDSEGVKVNMDNATSPAMATELLMGCMQDFSGVEKCFPIDGPRGTKIDSYPMLHDFQERRISSFQTIEHASEFLGGDIAKKLESGINVLELGCGAADPTRCLAENFPKSSFLASDISTANLGKARENCKNLSNVTFAEVDACDVSEDMAEKYDLVMLFDVFHDVAYPDKLLQGARKMLKPRGRYLMVDVDMMSTLRENKEKDANEAMFFYICSLLYCMPTSLYFPDGAGLGACAGAPKFEQLMKEGGFSNITQTVNALGLCLTGDKLS